MDSESDKNWASRYLLDPLNEPEPSAETGPGSQLRSSHTPPGKADSKSKSKQATASVSETSDSSTPRHSTHGSIKQSDNPFRASSEIPTSTSKNSINTDVNSRYQNSVSGGDRRRSQDEIARPLDVIRKSSLRAHRSPHLRKDHHHGVDSIDKLAGIEGIVYHHDGPFDVVSQARNISSRDSPVAALRSSNAEALRATPREAIIDSLRHHRPIDNVASLPPGIPDRTGRVLHYKEGTNMQRGEGENILGQWPAFFDYHPDDLKGKGEPSFTIERSLKAHKNGDKHRRVVSEGYEMTSSPRTRLGENNPFASRARASSGAAVTSPTKPFNTIDESNEHEREHAQGKSSGKTSSAQKSGSVRRRVPGESDVKE